MKNQRSAARHFWAASPWPRVVFTVVLLASLSTLALSPAAARHHTERGRSGHSRRDRDDRRFRQERADRERRAAVNARRGRRAPFAYLREADRQRGKRHR